MTEREIVVAFLALIAAFTLGYIAGYRRALQWLRNVGAVWVGGD